MLDAAERRGERGATHDAYSNGVTEIGSATSLGLHGNRVPSGTDSVRFTTGPTPPSGGLTIRLSLLSNDGVSAFFGFDNVRLVKDAAP